VEHTDVVRIVPVDPATGRDLDEGFYAVLATGPDGVRLRHAAPTLDRLRRVAAEGGEPPAVLPARPDPAAELMRDLAGAMQAGWSRAQGPGASGPDVIGEALRAFLQSPSMRRIVGDDVDEAP
jgi:hypothetical protein